MEDGLSDVYNAHSRPDMLRTQSVDVPRAKPHRFSFSRRGNHEDASPQLSPAGTPEGHHAHHNPLLALFHRDHYHHRHHHPDTIDEDLPGPSTSSKDREFIAQLTAALEESPPVARARSPSAASAFLPVAGGGRRGQGGEHDTSRRYSAPSPEPPQQHRGLLSRLGSHDSPTNNRSINDLLRQLGRRVVGRSPTCTSPTPTPAAAPAGTGGSQRRTSGANFLEVPAHGSPDDPGFRGRARSLDDGGGRVRPRPVRPIVPSDCAATYHIYDEIIREGKGKGVASAAGRCRARIG